MADPTLKPVDFDPFAESAEGPTLVPVEGDPFAKNDNADSGIKVIQVDNDPFDGAEPITDDWLEVGKKVVENSPSIAKAGFAGTVQRVAEASEAPVTTFLSTVVAPVGQFRDLMGAAGDIERGARAKVREALGINQPETAEWAAKMYADAAADMQENAPNVDPNSLKGFAYDAGTSLIQMIPGLVTGFATKSPAIGAATIAVPVGGQKYGEARAAGLSPGQAGEASDVYGFAEGIPEMMPLGVLMKPGGKFLWRTLKTAGAEGLSEFMTGLIQHGYDKGELKADMTWGDVLNSSLRDALLGTAVGTAVGAATHPFMREKTTESGAPPATPPASGSAPPNAAAASGAPSAEAGGMPSSPPAAAATIPTGPWNRPAPTSEPVGNLNIGTRVGLKSEGAAPQGATIEGVQDGYVYWRDDDGNQQTDKVADFKRDLTTPPPHKNPDRITGEPPAAGDSIPPPSESDINDFDPFAQKPREPKPVAPSPQQSMPLADTKRIQALRDAASANMVLAAEGARNGQRTPEWVASMRVEAAKLMDEAAALEAKLTPSRTAPDATAATPEQMAARRLGTLGRAAPAASEATTGPQQFEVTPPKAPAPPVQPALAPVERSEAEFPPEPVERPAAAQKTWQQRLREQIGNREASLNDPVAMARNLGTTPEAVTAELQGIATGKNAPIEIIRGTVKKDKKGNPVQSPRAGKWRYTPRPTGKAVESLSDFVYGSGGMAAGSFAGELQARDLHTARRPFKGNLIKPGARMDVQAMADHAMQAGYPIPTEEGNIYVADQRHQGGVGSSSANVDAFLDMLSQDQFGSRRTYRIGEEPQTEPGPRPMTLTERKREATRRLTALGLEPKGKTVEELEQELDAVLDAVGDATPLDTMDFAAAEIAAVDAMDPEAQEALRQEAKDDYPHEYDEAWFAAEVAEGVSPAQPAADSGVQEGDRAPGPVADRQGAAASRTEGAAETAPEGVQDSEPAQPETGGVLARLMSDESGAVPLDFWTKVKDALGLGKKGETAEDIAGEGVRMNLGTPGTLRSLSRMARYLRMAVSLAAIDRPSSVYWNAILRRDHTRAGLERAGVDQVKDYLGLEPAARARIDKVLEHDRLYGIDRKRTGRDVVVRIPDKKTPFGVGRPELSKPGEIVALDAAETAALHKLREFFDGRLNLMGEAVARERGYKGAFDRASIEKAIAEADHPRTRKQSEAALEILDRTEEMRRAGYVPFQRYGDTYITIKPKASETATPETAWFEMMDTGSIFDSVFSRDGGKLTKPLKERLAELQKRFPKDQFDYTVGSVTPQAIADLNLPAIERAFAALNAKQGPGTAKIIDDLMHQVYEARKAGLRKQSNNVPGYSTDFERAITDYVRQTSAIVARMSHRQDVDSAYDATQAHPVKRVREYWEKHKLHQEKEGDDYAGLRKLGFFMFLWANPASAIINLTQTPLVTQMQLGAWAGPRAPLLAHGGMLEGLGAIRANKNGLYVDVDSLGKTDAEKEMLRELQQEGRFDAAIAEDLGGGTFGLGKNPSMRPHLQKLSYVYELGASGFNTTETVNRVAAALAYFRAAQNPQLRERMRDVYKQDQNFIEMVARRGMRPIDIARFGVDETQFIGGKINRAPAMRGWGAVLLQFKTYIANYLRLMHKNFTRMGPRGKIAGAIMLTALVAISGMFGLPFGDDALKAADFLMEQATGIDPMIEYRTREFLADAGFGEYGAEVLTRGLGRNVFGADIGGRIGMGNIFPDDSITSLAPVVTGTLGRLAEANDRAHTGQPLGAGAAIAGAFGGSGAQNLLKGTVVYPNEGVSTRRGNYTVRPNDISLKDIVIKSLGFQPTKATRAGEKQYQESRIANATQQARTAMLTKIARLVVAGMDARAAGDPTKAAAYNRQIEALYAKNAAQLIDPDLPDWQKVAPAKRQAVRQRVLSLIMPEIANMRRAAKISRPTLQETPFVQP